VVLFIIKRTFFYFIPEKLNGITCGSSRFNREVSTSSTTGAGSNQKKNPPA